MGTGDRAAKRRSGAVESAAGLRDNRPVARTIEVAGELKRDALGRVELLRDSESGERRVRRVAAGGGLPGSGLVARVLLRREARALEALAGLPGAPAVERDPAWGAAPSLDGRRPAAAATLVRAYTPGAPLHRAEVLPRDFFELLEELVRAVHARGVCHNDLHKEQNVVVAEDGRPWLIDFQLASLHPRRARRFAVRCRDDLRHVHKHHRRYTRDGRGPEPRGPAGDREGARLPRSGAAWIWRRTAKPLYNLFTRGVLRTRDGEERRDSSGPWPAWTAPVGPGERGTAPSPQRPGPEA